MGDNLVSWKNKKQLVIAHSSSESEYRAIAHATSEITYVRQLLEELGYKSSKTSQLWFDN